MLLYDIKDDGELYDEFGNLKKKFRAKTQQPETVQSVPGAGRAGWEVEELGIIISFFFQELYNSFYSFLKDEDSVLLQLVVPLVKS